MGRISGTRGWSIRKQELRRLLSRVAEASPLKYADHVDGSGTALFEHVWKPDLEGVVAKQRSAPYISSREEWSTLQVFHGKVLTIVVRSSSTSSVYTGLQPGKGSTSVKGMWVLKKSR
jgi:ATP-dependent DNA ligase